MRNSMTPEQKIHHIQKLYREWLELEPRLAQAQKDWQHAITIMNELEAFYFNGEYGELYQAIEDGLQVDLTTDGEYSVMGEDTLWNAFHDKDVRLWQLLRFAVKHLDRFGDDNDDQP